VTETIVLDLLENIYLTVISSFSYLTPPHPSLLVMIADAYT